MAIRIPGAARYAAEARPCASADSLHLGGTLYSACHSNVAAVAVGPPGADAFPRYEPWPVIPHLATHAIWVSVEAYVVPGEGSSLW